MTMTIQELINQMNAAKTAMREHGEAALKLQFRDFFDKVPEVQEVCWTQYTPYFNDGDACEFDVYDPRFGTSVDSESFEEGEDCIYADLLFKKDGPPWRRPPVAPQPLTVRELQILASCEDLRKLWGAPEILETVFGDHVQIQATREGFNVMGCEHD